MNKQNRPNPFWIKITIVTTIFLCSFFFNKIDYYNEILKIISLIILIIKPLKNTVKDILSKKGFNKNFNITLSTLAIASIGYINESILTLLIYQIISYLENNKNNQLVVEVQKKKKTELTNIKRLKIGDIIKIQPNQPINLAGILQSKEATLLVNDNILKKSFGEKIDSGCTNLNSTIEIKVTEKYQNSKLKNDNDYVNNIIEEYRKKQDYTYINKIMRVIALILIFLPNLLTGEIQNRMIIIGSMFLILASSDMTILIEEKYLTKIIKNLRKKNITIKNIKVLKELPKIENVIFEKTDTLTIGEFRITGIVTDNKDKFFKYLNYGEYHSNHKIAQVIKDYKKVSINKKKIKNFKEIDGRGVECFVDKEHIVIGNAYFLKDKKIDFDKSYEVGTIIYLAVDNQYLGNLVISDAIDCSSKDVIKDLKGMGVKTFTILSGDNERIVNAVAKTLDINERYSNLTLDEKMFWTKHLKEYYKGKFLIIGNQTTSKSLLELFDLSLVLSSATTFDGADIYFENQCLEELPNIIKLLKHQTKVLKIRTMTSIILKIVMLIASIMMLPHLWLALLIDKIYMNIIE